jgi:predicted kinase
MDEPALIVFGGLPGSGKTTLARGAVRALAAVYLRIDVIEQALRDSGSLAGDVGPAGYLVAYGLAESNLRLGQSVVADCVNPLGITRAAWRRVAEQSSARLIEIEVICSDKAEHRRRVETRVSDIPGLAPPGWGSVLAHEYETWDQPRLVVDTAGVTVANAIAAVMSKITVQNSVRFKPENRV